MQNCTDDVLNRKINYFVNVSNFNRFLLSVVNDLLFMLKPRLPSMHLNLYLM